MGDIGGQPEQARFFESLLEESARSSLRAIGAELSAAASATTVDLRDARLVGRIGNETLWSFSCDDELDVPIESPAQLIFDGSNTVHVTVVSLDDTTVLLAVVADIEEWVEPDSSASDGSVEARIRLSTDLQFITARLRNRLSTLLAGGTGDLELAEALIDPRRPATDEGVTGDPLTDEWPSADERQQQVALLAIERGLRFTWGPPGTGKTRVLASAVTEAVHRGQRVLVLAQANAAVDVAAERIAAMLTAKDLMSPGRMLRVGTPAGLSEATAAQVLPSAIVSQQDPRFADGEERLRVERATIAAQLRSKADTQSRSDLTRRLDQVRQDEAQLTKDRRRAEAELIDEAQVLVTTLAKGVLADQIWEWQADVVIVDEASMVPGPMALALALRGAETLSFFGDFRQLPPVVHSADPEAQRWFGRDVFDLAGVVELVELGLVDQRMGELRTQFRMGEVICEAVNQFSYGGMLRTAPGARTRGIRLAELYPVPSAEIVVVDTSELGTTCQIEAAEGSWSRLNTMSAALTATVVRGIIEDDSSELESTGDEEPGQGATSVGIISPYRAQVRLLSAMLGGTDAMVATTHRFQGAERDAVVLDLVDAAGQRGPSRLTGTDAGLARRLLTVAISRARGKLVIVADLAFIYECHPLNSPVRQLLDICDDVGAETVAAQQACDTRASVSDAMAWLDSWDAAVEGIEQDLARHGGVQSSVVNLTSVSHATERLMRALGAASSGDLRVSGPYAAIKALDRSPAQLHAQPAGLAPFALIGPDIAWLGSRDVEQAAVRVEGARVVRTLRSLTGVDDRRIDGRASWPT